MVFDRESMMNANGDFMMVSDDDNGSIVMTIDHGDENDNGIMAQQRRSLVINGAEH